MRDSQWRRVAGPFGKRTRERALGSHQALQRGVHGFGYRWRGSFLGRFMGGSGLPLARAKEGELGFKVDAGLLEAALV
jgi:hypothetical protein